MRRNWTGCRRANALSAAALKYGGEHIEAGMTTWELDKLIQDFIVKHGGKPNFKGLYGFPGSACISLNDTVIHGIPSQTRSSARRYRQHRYRCKSGWVQRRQCLHLCGGQGGLEVRRLLEVTERGTASGHCPGSGGQLALEISAMLCRATVRRLVSVWCGSS